MAQWLRIHLPIQGMWVQSRGEELKSRMPWVTETQCSQINKFFLKKRERRTHLEREIQRNEIKIDIKKYWKAEKCIKNTRTYMHAHT